MPPCREGEGVQSPVFKAPYDLICRDLEQIIEFNPEKHELW